MASLQNKTVSGRHSNCHRGRRVAVKLCTAAVALVCLAGCGKSDSSQKTDDGTSGPAAFDPVQAVSKLLAGLGNGDQAALSVIDPARYTQHDPAAEDGLDGLKKYLAARPPHSFKITPVRLFRDGDFVVAHSVVESASPMVSFDIFRFDHDKIVEHWDDLQPGTADPNQSGHTMTDGPTAVAGESDTDTNKARARKFVEDVLAHGKLSEFDSYFDGDKYVQHDPGGRDGAGTLKDSLKSLAETGGTAGYDKVHRVLGQGNLVLVVSGGSGTGGGTAIYDLFRLEKGKLAEHWGVVEPVPTAESWKNNNGKF